ncbi:Uncharacterised protein [Bordetella pertussis]|nr:Uncharacterised protein [Bordetella pertussis]
MAARHCTASPATTRAVHASIRLRFRPKSSTV